MWYECDNCGHVDTDKTLVPEIKHYWERVDEDGPEPDGECSECGSLSYRLPTRWDGRQCHGVPSGWCDHQECEPSCKFLR